MSDISPEIQIAFTATQLILVFVIFLFTSFYSHIQNMIENDPKEESSNAINNLTNDIRDTFWSKCFILILSILLVFAVFIPVFYQTMISLIYTQIYDYISYCLILVFLFIFCFFSWSIKLSYDLSKRIKDLNGFTRIETVDYLLRGK